MRKKGDERMTFIDLGRVDEFDQDDVSLGKNGQVELVPAHPGYDLLVAFNEQSGVEFMRTTIAAWAVIHYKGIYPCHLSVLKEGY